MSLQYLLDRLAIYDTIVRGCTAIDTRQADLFDKVYTEDAIIDYSPLWGPDNYKNFRQWSKEWVGAASKGFSNWQHLVSNMVVEINGDTATAMTDYYNPVVAKDQSVLHAYSRWYDKLVRTPAGWRVSYRKTESLRRIDPSTFD